MRLHGLLLATPMVLFLSGCFEDSGSSSTSSSSSTPSATSLAAWAQTTGLSLSLAGDVDEAASTASYRSRWDSVVNLKTYAAQAQGDLQRIVADWASRDPVAEHWTVKGSQAGTGGELYLVGFSVDGVSQGGLVWVPNSGKSLPVVLFGHPDDAGVDESYLTDLGDLLGSSLDTQMIIVMPAYRGETAWLGSDNVESDTSAQSPWDRDVDDGLALLQATLDHFSRADSSRIAAVGYSRGGGVSLISAFRDRRIKSVFEIAGPADFFAPSIQTIALGLLAGNSYGLPGLDFLDARYLTPFWNKDISADSLRCVLLKRSPARLALSGLLPTTEAVHGTADVTVYPDQSAALKAADPSVTYYSVAGMTHSSFFTNLSQAAVVGLQLQTFVKTHLSL